MSDNNQNQRWLNLDDIRVVKKELSDELYKGLLQQELTLEPGVISFDPLTLSEISIVPVSSDSSLSFSSEHYQPRKKIDWDLGHIATSGLVFYEHGNNRPFHVDLNEE